MLRGINRQRIFEEDDDYRQFIDCLAVAKERSGAAIFAYALMSNHVHLLIAEGREPASITIKRLAVRYAGWFNWKNDRVGHLFQDRFASRAVEDDAYFITVLLYIHFNPVAEGLCTQPEDYPWSSRATWGDASSLVDLPRLDDIVPVATVRACESTYRSSSDDLEHIMAYKKNAGRMRDADVWSLIAAVSGAKTGAAFQRLPFDDQQRAAVTLWSRHVPVRQISRLTGLNRNRITRWAMGTVPLARLMEGSGQGIPG